MPGRKFLFSSILIGEWLALGSVLTSFCRMTPVRFATWCLFASLLASLVIAESNLVRCGGFVKASSSLAQSVLPVLPLHSSFS